MVVFDATILIDLLNPRTVADRNAKLEHLVSELQKSKSKILIPTPALSEFLAGAGKARDGYYQKISASSAFQVVAFDARAAMECALMIDETYTKADKQARTKTWTKAKFDWQIIAITKVSGANVIYSDDGDIARMGDRFGIKVIKTDDLPLPASARQGKLNLDA
jgi:predicted nucleic acid-binding protein